MWFLSSVAERSYPSPKVRGGNPECQAAMVQEQPRGTTPCPRSGRWPGGTTPRQKSSGYADAGGPRGATPHSRSGGAAVRRYPSSKVKSCSESPNYTCWPDRTPSIITSVVEPQYFFLFYLMAIWRNSYCFSRIPLSSKPILTGTLK